jgi:hypothetical protein
MSRISSHASAFQEELASSTDMSLSFKTISFPTLFFVLGQKIEYTKGYD